MKILKQTQVTICTSEFGGVGIFVGSEDTTVSDTDHIKTLIAGLLSMADKKIIIELIDSFPQHEMERAFLN